MLVAKKPTTNKVLTITMIFLFLNILLLRDQAADMAANSGEIYVITFPMTIGSEDITALPQSTNTRIS